MASSAPPSRLWLIFFIALLGGVAIMSSALAGGLAFEFALVATTSVMFAVAVLIRTAIWLWHHRPSSPLAVLRARLGDIAGDIGLRFALFQGALHFFIWLPPIKRAIPDANGYWADAWLAGFERRLFGADPWTFLHQLPDQVTPAIDALYAAWIPLIVVISLWVAVFGTKALVARYFLSWALAWAVLGIAVAHLLPSAGPIFGPDLGFGFHALRAELTDTAALRFHDLLWAMHETGSRDLGGGISAMPSMHCALTCIFVAAAWRSRWRILALIYAGLIWFGSVYLGWHYVLDGVVSAIGVALIWRVSGLVCSADVAMRVRSRRLASTPA